MDRRMLLSASGSALSVGLVGCLGEARAPWRSNTGSPSCDVELNEPGPDTDRLVSAWARNDVPPYEIAYPQDAEDSDDWNPAYLGERMSETPSVGFVERSKSRSRIRQPPEFTHGTSQYVVELIENESELAATVEGESADFEENVLVLVGDCCGSSSVEHRWARVEETQAGIHLHGYLERPWSVTPDLSPRYSLLEIERPTEGVDRACVSLTTREERRVHFDSTDGVVSLVAGVIANDTPETLDVGLRLSTTDGETRVDDTLTIAPKTEWQAGIGLFGEANETFRVDLRVDQLDVEVSEEYRADGRLLGFRITRDGSIVVGLPHEI